MGRLFLINSLCGLLFALAGNATSAVVVAAAESSYRLPVDTGHLRVVREISHTIWIGADNGLFYWQPGEKTLQRVPSVTQRVYAICGSQGKIWVGSQDALRMIVPMGPRDQESGGGQSAPVALDVGRIYALHESGDILWIGGPRGLFRWREGTAQPEEVSLPTAEVTTILQNSAGLWVGTDGGLFRLTAGATVPHKLPFDPGPVGALHGTRAGMWIDAANGQFWWKDGDREPHRITADTGVVFAVGEEDAGLLLGAEKGLFEWTPGVGEPRCLAFKGIPVTGLQTTAAGALVGTREGLFFLDKHSRQTRPLSVRTGAVSGIYQAATDCWISAANGLYRIPEKDLAGAGRWGIFSPWIIYPAIFATILCLAAYYILIGRIQLAGVLQPFRSGLARSTVSRLRESVEPFVTSRHSKLASLRLPTAKIKEFPVSHAAVPAIAGSPRMEQLRHSPWSAGPARGVLLPELSVEASMNLTEAALGVPAATLDPSVLSFHAPAPLGWSPPPQSCQLPGLYLRTSVGFEGCGPAEDGPALNTAPAAIAAPRLERSLDRIQLPQVHWPVKQNGPVDGEEGASEISPVVTPACMAPVPEWRKPERTPALPPAPANFHLPDWGGLEILSLSRRRHGRPVRVEFRPLLGRILWHTGRVAVVAAILLAIFFAPSLSELKNLVGAKRAAWGRSIRDRAAVRYEASSLQPLTEWKGSGDWARTWSSDAAGRTRPGRFALFGPSVHLTNYRFEFLARIERGGIGWAVRGEDDQNYYAIRLEIERPQPRPIAWMVRYPVLSGQAGAVTRVRVQTMLQGGIPWRVRTEVENATFTVSLEGHVVGSWKEDRLRRGGVGFFSERRDSSQVYWMNLWSQDDLVGRLCAWLVTSEERAGETAKSEVEK